MCEDGARRDRRRHDGSGAFDSEVEADRLTVQVGDPFYEAVARCLELHQTDAVVVSRYVAPASRVLRWRVEPVPAWRWISTQCPRAGMTAFELMLSEARSVCCWSPPGAGR